MDKKGLGLSNLTLLISDGTVSELKKSIIAVIPESLVQKGADV
jgi:hypothetical protein